MVSLKQMNVLLTQDEVRRILETLGFESSFLRVIDDLRWCSDISVYTPNARVSEAPWRSDCSSLIKWAFGRSGIHIPRLTIQQREFGQRVDFDHIRAHDLVFMNGARHNYFINDPSDGVGHVGVYTRRDTVIHLTREGLVEESISDLFLRRDFRGAVRIISNPLSTIVLKIPPTIDVESEDDLTWLLLRQLPKIVAQKRRAAASL